MKGRRDRASGSVLLLMPAAVLVVVVLGSIALDSSTLFLAHRDLAAAASAAANDAVTYGADERAFREHGRYVLDPARVERAVDLSLEARGLAGAIAPPVVAVDGLTVSVTLTASVSGFFTKAIPGAPDAVTVRVTASASAASRSS